MFLGGIEAGGTKMVCGIGDEKGVIHDSKVFPTTDPQQTVDTLSEYFISIREKFPWERIGLASFGPLDLNPHSSTFGYITSTPKTDWKFCNIKGLLENGLHTEIILDTDVNAAAIAEYRWGASKGKNVAVYITVGTGIGGGVLIDGKPIHGLLHPEMGHIRLHPKGIEGNFKGVCPYHTSCLEGLASGPAILARWGISGQDLPDDHKGWDEEADYLAEGISDIILMLSPQIIILGGGVMDRKFLYPLIWRKVQSLLNNYIQRSEILEQIETYIVPPALNVYAGLLGAVALVSE